jgi:hypothetical protein
MSDSLTINYRESYFQHPSLTKIDGDPTYTSLAKLARECKANGKSVATTLGGGLQGYLGLVCSAAAYERVSPGVPFVRPTLPTMPDLTNANGPQIAAEHIQYNDKLKMFQQCNLIERTIIQQINTAIDDDCLADMIDDETGLLTGTIPEIFEELYTSFGSITPQSLAVAKTKLETTNYDHSRPIVNVFTSINEYANMADASEAPETPIQLINIGLIILTRATIFSSDIRKWHAQNLADKTWPRFKTHFKEAQRSIKRSQPTTTTDSLGYHEQASAATIVDQVMAKLATISEDESINAAEQVAEQQMNQQFANMASAAQQNQTMIDKIESLTSTISKLKTQSKRNGRNGGGGGDGRGRNNGDRNGNQNGGRGNNNDRAPPAYCWTHGNCAHKGSTCNTKAEGHIDTATYANMQGGSTNRCHWL